MGLSEWILTIAGSLIVSFLCFISIRVWFLSSDFSKFKIDVVQKIHEGQEKAEAIFKKQVSEGILAHKRVDVLDRLVSAVTDREFNSSKNIASGAEEIPGTVIVRRVVQKYSREN